MLGFSQAQKLKQKSYVHEPKYFGRCGNERSLLFVRKPAIPRFAQQTSFKGQQTRGGTGSSIAAVYIVSIFEIRFPLWGFVFIRIIRGSSPMSPAAIRPFLDASA